MRNLFTRNGIPCVTALCLAAGMCCAAQQAANEEPQRFAVLRSEALVVPFETLSNAEVNCSISGFRAASRTCSAEPPARRPRLPYHYITALGFVDAQGIAYGIASPGKPGRPVVQEASAGRGPGGAILTRSTDFFP